MHYTVYAIITNIMFTLHGMPLYECNYTHPIVNLRNQDTSIIRTVQSGPEGVLNFGGSTVYAYPISSHLQKLKPGVLIWLRNSARDGRKGDKL